MEQEPQNINDIVNNIFAKNAERIEKNRNKEKYKVSKLGKFVFGLILVIIAAIVFTFGISYIWTEYLFYNQLGYSSVFTTEVITPILLWVGGFIIGFLIFMLAQSIIYKGRPSYYNNSDTQSLFDGFARNHKKIFIVISIIIGVIVGGSFGGHWKELLLMFNSTTFGKLDPVFNLDYSFYIFQLPGVEIIINNLFSLFLLTFALVIIYNALFKNITVSKGTKYSKLVFTNTAKVQLIVVGLLSLIVAGFKIYFYRFRLLSENNGKITGANYTAVHALFPGNTIFIVAVALIGISLLIALFTKKLKFSIISITIFIVIALGANTVYPLIVENLIAGPNAQELEAPYIERNIEATKFGYNLNDVTIENYSAKTDATKQDIKKDAETTMQIRLLDPQVVSPTFRQIQQIKQYYNFVNTLSVDKYNIGGKSQDTVIAAREMDLDGNSSDQRNWVNDHTVYTHGYGVVAAYGNKVSSDGNPLFFEKDIPTVGDLTNSEAYEPRIYFSPNAPEYSIVGSSSSDKQWEFDYPSDTNDVSNTSGIGATTAFNGDGGPKIDNLFQKILYSIRLGSSQVFFSDRVTNESQVLMVRDPQERVKKAAPYLTLDGRMYPAVINGKVLWLVDGYTTSDSLPYSQLSDFGNETKDSLSNSPSNTNLAVGRSNYIRNSVKATVDAYSGKVTLYAFDEQDPILKTWSKIFPSTIKPLSEIDGQLMSHIRYPESLFKVQRSILSKYHIDNAYQFFSGEDFWHIPKDPTTGTSSDSTSGNQPPYYLTIKMPGEKNPAFSLTSGFIPGGESTREILTGFLSAASDAGSEQGVVSEDYGKLRLLVLPKNSTVPGPGQAQNNFNSNASVSQALNLLQTGSSKIERGNLLTLPVAGGLVYVQPVYVKSSGDTSFPLLKKVLVSFGDSIGFDDTLEGAMKQVFGDDVATTPNAGAETEPGTGPSAETGTTPSSETDSNATGNSELVKLSNILKQLDTANSKAKDALSKGDWTEYGKQQQIIDQLLKQVE
jgi:uncharacterized membrane protein (UPF0182 family)